MINFQISEPETSVAVRTLLASGYTIVESHRQPRHIEIHCQRDDLLSATINYLIAITDSDGFTENEVEDIRRTATSQCLVPVLVARVSNHDWISWQDFTEALGGAVPSWQALSETYSDVLIATSQNTLPYGEQGEAWLMFEDLVASGLEFVFGRRVRRLGGRKRGKAVSDLQAQTPHGNVLVVDAKASLNGFDVTWSALRPLVEYVKKQQQRQQGQLELLGALMVSSSFQQDDSRLQELGRQFYGETRVTISFLNAETLSQIIWLIRDNIDIRNAIRWHTVIVGGNLLLKTVFDEIKAARVERLARGG